MQDFSPRNSKAEILRGMMRNPEHSKLLKEAMDSPLGSTSRQKAKKVFSIMSKLNASRDGIGGPGMMYERMGQEQMAVPEVDPVHIPTDNSKGMVIFHKIPQPNINFTNDSGTASRFKPRPMSFDGSGGPGDFQIPTYANPADQINPPQIQDANNVKSVAVPEMFPGITSALKGAGQWASQQGGFFGTPAAASMANTVGNVLGEQPTLPPPPPTPPSYNTQDNGNVSADYMAQAEAASGVTPPSGNSYQGPYAPQNQTPPSTTPTPTTTNPQNSSSAIGVARILKVSPDVAISSINIKDLVQAVATNEGFTNGTSTIAISNNNPGNLKFIGQAGATQGGPASDGGYYAKFANAQDGWNALQNDLQSKISSGKYNTLADVMNAYAGNHAGTSDPGKYTGLSAAANAAVNQDTGAGMFAFNQLTDPSNPLTHGQTMEQMDAANQTKLWDKYNIGGLQNQINTLQYEGATLPKDVTAYITARDQYLTQTDSNISNFISSSMNGTAMSDPVNAANAQAHLNYLYTLRGRQNQSYIGYLTDAVNQHQADLNNITNLYSTALNSYQTDLKNADSVTEGQYKMYAQALADMYTEIGNAPAKLQTASLNAANLLIAQAQAATDPLKLGAQDGLIEQGKKVENYWGWDGSKEISTGIDLVKTLQDFSTLEPSIQPVNVIQTYVNDIEKYIGQPNDTVSSSSSGSATSNAVTSSLKKQLLEAAIVQLAHLSTAYANDPTISLLGQQEAQSMASHLGAQVGGSLTNVAPKLMGSIKSLNPTGWFSSKQPPTEAQFVANVTKATGSTADASIASSIYKAFQRYIKDGGNPAGFVNAFLNDVNNGNSPYSADQFAQNVGKIYAQDLVQSAFSTTSSTTGGAQ